MKICQKKSHNNKSPLKIQDNFMRNHKPSTYRLRITYFYKFKAIFQNNSTTIFLFLKLKFKLWISKLRKMTLKMSQRG